MVAVAINARILAWSRAGIGRYVESLIREIAAIPDTELHLFISGGWVQPSAEPLSSEIGSLVRLVMSCPWSLRQAIEGALFNPSARRRSIQVYHEPDYLPLAYDGPVVTTVHDLSHVRYPETHPRARVRRMERLLPAAIERSAIILTVSEFSRSEISAHFGVPKSKIVVTPLAAAEAFRPASLAEAAPILQSLGLQPGSYVLCVGTVQPRKNIATAARAHAMLPARLRDRRPLVVVGAWGWGDPPFAEELSRFERDGAIKFAGRRSDFELAALYSHASALLFPSLYEGFGLPVLEAMACGAPVIASNRAATGEVAGSAAVLVDPLNVEEVATALRELLDDHERALELRRRGLARAAMFSWKDCAARTVAAYRTAAA